MWAQCSSFDDTSFICMEYKYVRFPQYLKQNIYIYEDINYIFSSLQYLLKINHPLAKHIH